MSEVITTDSETETFAVGRRLATTMEPGTVVLLSGELGTGKTALVRGLAAGLGVDPSEVSSPTFTLVQEYRGGRLALYHADLYRLTSREADDLGLDELADQGGVLAVEWPDRLAWDAGRALLVSITHGSGDNRIIAIDQPAGNRYSDR